MGRGTGADRASVSPRRARPYNPLIDAHEDAIERPVVLCDSTHALITYSVKCIIEDVDEHARELAMTGVAPEHSAVSRWLPGQFTYYYKPTFLNQFSRAAEKVAAELTVEDPQLECTAEQLAAHAILTMAEDVNQSDLTPLLEENGITDLVRSQADIEWLKTSVFEDHDALLLFSPELDGIERTEAAEELGLVNLHPDDWFTPFREGSRS